MGRKETEKKEDVPFLVIPIGRPPRAAFFKGD